MNEDASTPNQAAEPGPRQRDTGGQEESGAEPHLSANGADTADPTAEEGGAGADDDRPDGWVEVTETGYEPLEGGGHRVTRRTTRRRVTVEDISEEITEELPPHAYRAPRSATHPVPVG